VASFIMPDGQKILYIPVTQAGKITSFSRKQSGKVRKKY